MEYRMGFMIIRMGDDVQKIHLSEIGVLIIESTAVSFTAGLLNELNRNKIKTIFCDELHNPYGEIVSYYGAHDSSLSIKKQISWGKEIKSELWKTVIQNKIMRQGYNLEQRGYLREAKLLDSYIVEVQPGDITNREGHAAKVYFNALFGMNFTRDDENTINAALDYVYSLILATFNREITASGRLTQLGIWHDSRFNHFNLSSDLMEEFRPFGDRFILSLDLEKHGYLSKDLKHELLQFLEMKILVDKKIQIFPNAVKIYCKKVFEILDNNKMGFLAQLDYV